MFNNMVTALLTHTRIETTEAKAKELRRFAEETINLGVAISDLLAKSDNLTVDERGKVLHARRQAAKTLKTDVAMKRLFNEIAPHFAKRPGGYTRIIKTRVRHGDAAPMAFIELVGMFEVAAPTAE